MAATQTSSSHGQTAHGITTHDLVTRGDIRLDRDLSRVITRLSAPGTRTAGQRDRAAEVVERVLDLDDATVEQAWAEILRTYRRRHRDLQGVLEGNFRTMRHRVPEGADLDEKRRQLIGALFTGEIAIEGAALTNPSLVAHPDQSGTDPGDLRFLMSARAIGEGHVSSVEFRTGVVTRDGGIRMDAPSPYATCGSLCATTYERAMLAEALYRAKDDDEVAGFLLRQLPSRFGEKDVEQCLRALPEQLRVLKRTQRTISDMHWFLACQYEETFEAAGGISERTLWPMSPAERSGMEDARFVRFTDDDGSTDYRATYTANNASGTSPQLLRTQDFRTFQSMQLFGKAAGKKDLALFPRKVGGRYLAMSRWDQEHNAVATSEDGMIWREATVLEVPIRPWRLLKVGNCGSPIETEAGWLVLTHGVGPMHAYALGALLLDLEDPTRVLGELDEPLLMVAPDERDGYVPNVVYTCGALKHGDTLVVPFGFGDMGIEFASVSVPELVNALSS